jgi:hypothetical protein
VAPPAQLERRRRPEDARARNRDPHADHLGLPRPPARRRSGAWPAARRADFDAGPAQGRASEPSPPPARRRTRPPQPPRSRRAPAQALPSQGSRCARIPTARPLTRTRWRAPAAG